MVLLPRLGNTLWVRQVWGASGSSLAARLPPVCRAAWPAENAICKRGSWPNPRPAPSQPFLHGDPGPFRCLVQFVVILDPSETASRLIGGRPGEATELG